MFEYINKARSHERKKCQLYTFLKAQPEDCSIETSRNM